MQINNTTSTTFGALDTSKVWHVDKGLIRENKKALENLGKSYDISIESLPIRKSIVDGKHKKMFEVTAKPLAEGMNFFQKLFRKSGNSYCNAQTDNIVEKVEEAILDLRKKTLLAKLRKH